MSLNKKIISLIIFGFIISSMISFLYLEKYDNYRLDNKTHIMIKNETLYHYEYGSTIANEVRKGKSFFLSGGEVFTKPLYQRIIAIYSLITNYELMIDIENEKKVKIGNKLLFFLFQSFIYYFSLYFFYKELIKHYPHNNCWYIIMFLIAEPTIIQYHSSFWTESIYLTLQIIITTLLLKRSISININLFIGILIGVLFLQRTSGLYYLFPVIIYIFFIFRKKFFKPVFFIIFGFSLMIGLLGLHNLKRAGVFYFIPTEAKYVMHYYFASNILAKKMNTSTSKVRKIEAFKGIDWLKTNNNIYINEEMLKARNINYSVLTVASLIDEEKDRIKFYNYISKRSRDILLDSPYLTINSIISNVAHFIIINPSFIFYDYDYEKIKNKATFFKSDTHKNLIPYRIAYSLIIYIICFFGLIYCVKKNDYKNLFLLIFSILFYLLIFGWYGKTRLFVPNLIFMSIFFGNGIVYLKQKKKKKKSHIKNN